MSSDLHTISDKTLAYVLEQLELKVAALKFSATAIGVKLLTPSSNRAGDAPHLGTRIFSYSGPRGSRPRQSNQTTRRSSRSMKRIWGLAMLGLQSRYHPRKTNKR
jgi:hypothetical protein